MSSSSAIAEEDRATLAQHRAVPNNKRNFFTGLRFEVEQASRGLSAIAELLVRLDNSVYA